tara:strand:- start:8996 stop:9136 length:141 start_codon:yes stop_codon:yes gene_type:complete
MSANVTHATNMIYCFNCFWRNCTISPTFVYSFTKSDDFLKKRIFSN